METFLEITKLQLLVWWRQTLMLLGRVFWFAVAYGLGKAFFDSDMAASVLGGVAAVMSYYVGVSNREVDESVTRVTGRQG